MAKPSVLYNREDGTITLGFMGKVRRLEVRDIWGDGKKLETINLVGVCRHRTGKKLYPVRLDFYLDKRSDLESRIYHLEGQYSCINRQARLVDWLEDYLGEDTCVHLTQR